VYRKNTFGFVVPYFVAKGERIERKGTHERTLRKMRYRNLSLPLLCLLDESMWPCKERNGVLLRRLVFLPHKKMKELRFLITFQSPRAFHHHSLQSPRVLHHHSHQRQEVDQID